VAQWHYEPSETGAPGMKVFPIWIGCTGLALVWALVRGVRSGSLVRFCSVCLRGIRKPLVYGSALLILGAIGVPALMVARHIRETQRVIVYPLLDEVEAVLTDDFIAGIKREHMISAPQKIQVPPSARSLFVGIKDGRSLRIFIPVNDSGYLPILRHPQHRARPNRTGGPRFHRRADFKGRNTPVRSNRDVSVALHRGPRPQG
jgi:hypothetical protein